MEEKRFGRMGEERMRAKDRRMDTETGGADGNETSDGRRRKQSSRTRIGASFHPDMRDTDESHTL